jgi:hypothetical protein
MVLHKCAFDDCNALISMRGKFCRPCQDLVREIAARERYHRKKQEAKQQIAM